MASEDEHPLQSAWSSACHAFPFTGAPLTARCCVAVWEHNRGAVDNYGTNMKKLGDFSTVRLCTYTRAQHTEANAMAGRGLLALFQSHLPAFAVLHHGRRHQARHD